jgi:tRNA pseudouridine55 synthase
MGCGAYLSGLRRTQIGRFTLDEATPLDEAAPNHLLPLREALVPMPMLELNEGRAADIRMGRSIEASIEAEDTLVALLEAPSRVFSIARANGNVLHPECVIPLECFDDPV